MIEAKKHCCEECVMGMPMYIPCNKPATKIIAADGTTYRMCDACADHSVNNRGLELIGTYSRDMHPNGGPN